MCLCSEDKLMTNGGKNALKARKKNERTILKGLKFFEFPLLNLWSFLPLLCYMILWLPHPHLRQKITTAPLFNDPPLVIINEHPLIPPRLEHLSVAWKWCLGVGGLGLRNSLCCALKNLLSIHSGVQKWQIVSLIFQHIPTANLPTPSHNYWTVPKCTWTSKMSTT